MAASPTPSGWPAKRLGALALTLALVAIAAYALSQGIIGTLPVLAIGIVLGATYVVRGGSLPQWVYPLMRTRDGGRLNADDDPSNLPVRVYLPILLGVLLLAALVFYLGMK